MWAAVNGVRNGNPETEKAKRGNHEVLSYELLGQPGPRTKEGRAVVVVLGGG
jgi:hypothetical protein